MVRLLERHVFHWIPVAPEGLDKYQAMPQGGPQGCAQSANHLNSDLFSAGSVGVDFMGRKWWAKIRSQLLL
jgi:hypothetical protein